MKKQKELKTSIIRYGSLLDVVLAHKSSPGDGQHGRGKKGGGEPPNQ